MYYNHMIERDLVTGVDAVNRLSSFFSSHSLFFNYCLTYKKLTVGGHGWRTSITLMDSCYPNLSSSFRDPLQLIIKLLAE